MEIPYRFPVYPVDSCPLSLNCSNDSTYMNRYFCLPNSKITSLVEFCYDTIRPMVEKDYCIVLSGTGTVDYWKCLHFTDGCPPNYYFSDTVYRYPMCLDINEKKSCFTASPGCNESHHFIDTNRSEFLPNTTLTSDTGDSSNFVPVIVAVVVTFIAVISLISAIYYMHVKGRLPFPWCFTKRPQSTRNTIDEEEVEFLEDTEERYREEVEHFAPEEAVEKLHQMFNNLETFLKMPEFDEDLQQELSAECPDYMNVLQRRKADLVKKDTCIVIAGETSAGKTTLINKLVGSRVFISSNIAATGKICRIRNSSSLGVTTYTKTETLKKQENAENMKELRALVKRYTDVNELKEEDKDVYFVDVYLKVPILKGNVIIVDTPGIGESSELDNILLDYLPNAVSFVFVINASNAGGIQEATLLRLLKAVIQNKDKMPCFDPRETIFLTNKWDAIKEDRDDEDDDDIKSEKEKTWNLIMEKLKKGWQWISDDNVFRVSLIEVGKDIQNEYTEEYERFKKSMIETVERNKNRRILNHFSFLDEFTRNAERGTRARLHLLERSDEQQKGSVHKVQESIQNLRNDCEQIRKELLDEKREVESKLAEKMLKHLQSKRDQILNPPGKVRILKIPYRSITEEVPKRFEQGIKDWCQQEEATSLIRSAETKIKEHVGMIESKLENIELEMAGFAPTFAPNFSRLSYIGLGFLILLSPSTVVGVMFAMIFVPSAVVYEIMVGREDHHLKVIKCYDKCLESVTKCKLLLNFEKSFGEEYLKMVVHIFDDTLPKKIESYEKTNQALLEKLQLIREKHQTLSKLRYQIKQHQLKIEELRVSLKLLTD